jgi:hypothetical protein
MLSEEKTLIKNLDLHSDILDKKFIEKAKAALEISDLYEMFEFIKKYDFPFEPDELKSFEENKNRLLFLINEEFYKIRDAKFKGRLF